MDLTPPLTNLHDGDHDDDHHDNHDDADDHDHDHVCEELPHNWSDIAFLTVLHDDDQNEDDFDHNYHDWSAGITWKFGLSRASCEKNYPIIW